MLGEPQHDEAIVHFQRGLVLERANRVEEAVEEYRRALEHNPHLAEAHDALGNYYHRHGLLAKAAEEFRIVANLEGGFLAYFNIGSILIELGRYEEAIDALLHCLTFDSNDPAVHYQLGLAQFLRGDDYAALYHLQLTRQRYPNDSSVHVLIGRCHLRLGAYDEAEMAFRAALQCATNEAGRLRIQMYVHAVERHREIGVIRSLRERFYADHGAAYLGSTHDDGSRADEFSDFHFTYPDIAISLHRLIRLARLQRWRLTCVAPIDRLAEPLAQVLAELLDVPPRSIDALRADDIALLALASGHEAELLKLAVERSPCATVTFCLGLDWLRHHAIVPDVIGVVAHHACSVPWEAEFRRLRAHGAPLECQDLCLQQAAQQIMAAVQAPPPDLAIDQCLAFFQTFRRFRYLEHACGASVAR
ncbi:MAG: tetratricopeptide repeat protein [Roseiflexus sp.]|nr:tetratricopeptide repeat protein [Roseiflexus sp.]MCS7290513.1 tetratricopeptide repeat protein [Roseiflexus sp.]MDW8148346.1 tetratricopeptide repeat protein [Roseiflexaceae bacterium]MDW8232280.1 tetratricopeptide repeat protein [Roseiflexaceae bacterium]